MLNRGRGISVKGWKKIRNGLAALAVLAIIGAPSVSFAEATDTKTTSASAATATAAQGELVALGDSITFGYNLGDNKAPSPEAFPFLMGQFEHLNVKDLGVPGWTTADLLKHLNTDVLMQNAVKSASVITVDIGSNDLLQTALKYGSPQSIETSTIGTNIIGNFVQSLTSSEKTMTMNLTQILVRINALNPTASVVLYNLYDPIPTADTFLHPIAEKAVSTADAEISQIARQFNLPVADAYDAFQNHPAYILPNDVHPTAQGQAVLASQGEQTLAILRFEQAVHAAPAWHSLFAWLRQQLAVQMG